MDRIVAFNLMYAAVDFNAVSLLGWLFVVFVGKPTILKVLHGVLTVGCIIECAVRETTELTSTLPIAIALSTKWAYAPMNSALKNVHYYSNNN